MKVQVNLSALAETRWYEYAVRFLFGGLVTVAAGIIARQFGPVAGGLFLAFPAIFPASATLIEKHEKEKKRRVGLNGTKRAAQAVGVDAAGAAIGCIGLVAFASIVWQGMPNYSVSFVLTVATLTWLVLAVGFWALRKQF
jgi:uncharacterized protein DUF3147